MQQIIQTIDKMVQREIMSYGNSTLFGFWLLLGIQYLVVYMYI